MKCGFILIYFLIISSVYARNNIDIEIAAPYGGINHPKALVWDLKNPYIDNLLDIDNADLLEGKADSQPWSGDYWMSANGEIAYRYSDNKLKTELSKKKYKKSKNKLEYIIDYILDNPVLNSKDTSIINKLSPAEKYDLLIGDKNQKFTKEVLRSAKSSKHLRSWEGICEGWAAASMLEKRPLKSVTVTAYHGEKITFYPDDLKALMSFFWSRYEYKDTYIRSQCVGNESRSGRKDCYKINPGSWHLALINQLGINKVPFIIDDSTSYEVWNYPLDSYQYQYYNLITGEKYKSLEIDENKDGVPDALVTIKGVQDKFEKYRSPKTKYLLGILMDIKYIGGTKASHRKIDKPSDDNIKELQLFYDLEISSDYKILGGEWYDDIHPDFLWSPVQGTVAELPIEKSFKLSWDGKGPLPAKSHIAAIGGQIGSEQVASQSEKGLPLPHIFKALVELSR